MVDRFLGQNYVPSAQWPGKNVRYFKPDHLTLFELVLIANVVHRMYPTSSVLGEQCHFYVRLVYTALEKYFCTSASKSTDESKDTVCPMVYKIEEEMVSKLSLCTR